MALTSASKCGRLGGPLVVCFSVPVRDRLLVPVADKPGPGFAPRRPVKVSRWPLLPSTPVQGQAVKCTALDQTSHDLSPNTAGPFNPFNLFIVMLMDSICSDAGETISLNEAKALWTGLQLSQKVTVYQALMPLCVELNMEPGSPQVLKRLQNYRQPQTALEQLLSMCMHHYADCAATGRPFIAPASSHAEQHETHAVFKQMTADEQDGAGLQATLHAAGLSHAMVRVSTSMPRPTAASDVQQAMGMGAGVSLHWRAGVQASGSEQAWNQFVGKCKLAWDVFFPPKQTLTPAGAQRARLQMVLVSDRSGLDLPTLMRIRNQSLASLAQSHGWDDLAELELQVASRRGNEETVLSLPLSHVPTPFMIRNADDYDYEYQDEDDWEENIDMNKVSEIAEVTRPNSTIVPSSLHHKF